jgi:hypothetical protein
VTSPVYDERLTPPAWLWAAALGLAVLVAASLHSGADGVARSVLPYAVLPPLALAAVALRSRGRVRIEDGMLSVPGARIPVARLREVVALDAEATRRMRGPSARPEAFVATRAWLPRSVVVTLDDPEDDTPYWLIGTRRPEALARALPPPADRA